MTLDLLQKNQVAMITGFNLNEIPLKFIEMGCFPGSSIELLQRAPFGGPLYFKINETHLSIRMDLAREISIEITKN
ncbi:MAG: ferrous iron transport protein A [Flavobacterium sp.]|nr:ferrous iron transport protein A [Candidatus Neoflavobacterium equi]